MGKTIELLSLILTDKFGANAAATDSAATAAAATASGAAVVASSSSSSAAAAASASASAQVVDVIDIDSADDGSAERDDRGHSPPREVRAGAGAGVSAAAPLRIASPFKRRRDAPLASGAGSAFDAVPSAPQQPRGGAAAPRSPRGSAVGGTLVVCPMSLCAQWADEIATRTRRGRSALSTFVDRGVCL